MNKVELMNSVSLRELQEYINDWLDAMQIKHMRSLEIISISYTHAISTVDEDRYTVYIHYKI
jgi:hypothetical protein